MSDKVPEQGFFKPEDFVDDKFNRDCWISENEFDCMLADYCNRLLRERGTVVWCSLDAIKGTPIAEVWHGDNPRNHTHRALLINIQKINQCEIWPGCKNKNGYGYAYDEFTQKMVLAHRLMYQRHHQVNLTSDCVIMHSCDNPSCVKIEHLSAGTQKDNLKDMDNKGRRPMGEDHHSAKITLEIAEEIRQRYSRDEISQRKLGEEYGLSQSTIFQIVNNQIWQPLKRELPDSWEKMGREIYAVRRSRWTEKFSGMSDEKILDHFAERARKLAECGEL